MRAGKLPALFFTTAIALTGLAGKAHALDAGDHKPFAQMEQSLRQEHQVEIARALFVLNPEDPARTKDLCLKFTVNAQGEAYILLSDNMDDSKAHVEVVYGKIKNAHLYNPRVINILPAGVSPQSSLADKISISSRDGAGIMLNGQGAKKLSNGTESVSGTVTVMVNLSDTNDRILRDTVYILVTAENGRTQADQVMGQDVQYYGVPDNVSNRLSD